METEELLFTCRACLQLSSSVKEIFLEHSGSTSIIIKMLTALSVQVTEDDKLPNVLCSTCFTSLEAGYNFVQTFNRTQEILKQCMDSGAGSSTVSNNSQLATQNTAESSTETEDTNHVSVEDESEQETDLEDIDQDSLIVQSIKLTREFLRTQFDLPIFTASDNDEIETDDEGVPNMNETEQTQEKQKSFKNAPLQCPLCSQSYRKSHRFASHLKQHNQKIPCKFCDVSFDNAQVFLEHYRTKHRYQCHICKKFITRCDAFARHMQMHDNTFKYKCPIETCSKVYAKKNNVKSHLETMHSDNRNFLCSLCGASFKNYDNLRYHIKKHQGPSHLCPYCGRRFMQAGHLKHHIWRHTGTKPYKCAICEKAFVTKRLLRLHVEKEVCLRGNGSRRVIVEPLCND